MSTKNLILALGLMGLVSCANGGTISKGSDQKEAGQGGSSSSILPSSDSKEVFAEINGKKITEGEVNQKIESRLSSIKNSIFELQLQGVNAIIIDELLKAEAEKKKMSVDELIKKEVDEKVGEVSEEEVKDFYEKNKARMRGQPLEKVKETIKNQLASRQASIYHNNLISRLRDEADIKIHLERPRVDVSADDDHFKGAKDAKVTIIEFTDYQCPFCVRVRPTIEQILKDYDGQVKYVLRDFPLGFHAQAKKAAEAAQCAGDQGKYWEYSDKLWENQKDLQVPQLKEYAKAFNLDQAKFEQCLDSGKFAQEVAKDMNDGRKAGVTGTPAFFINGQALKGAKPYPAFKEVIDMELMKSKS
ncbi:MAG: thioredoxin domain-containing protein [Deltaproteobacteria bacterium]|nr:thioredoxin domain-containing protein [Deltaproteobacteria bacterium]